MGPDHRLCLAWACAGDEVLVQQEGHHTLRRRDHDLGTTTVQVEDAL
jgi:hypothetical protein